MVRHTRIVVALGTLTYVAFGAAQVFKTSPPGSPDRILNTALFIFLTVLAVVIYLGKRWAMHTLRVYCALLLAWLGLWTFIMSSTRSPSNPATLNAMKRNVVVQAGWGLATFLLLGIASKKEEPHGAP